MSTSLRITKNAADRIVKAAVKDAMSADRDAHQRAENALVERTITHLLKTLNKADELILARRLSQGWIRTTESIQVSVQSTYVTLTPRGVEGSPPPRIPYLVVGADKTIPFKDPLNGEIYRHNNASKSLDERAAMLGAKVRGILASVTTYGKLAEVWPEGIDYWGPYRDRAADEQKNRSLPLVKIDEVNKLLGIPKGNANVA